MNLKVCDICKKDPRIGNGNCSDTVTTATINDRRIDLCGECAKLPFTEVAAMAKSNGAFRFDLSDPFRHGRTQALPVTSEQLQEIVNRQRHAANCGALGYVQQS